MHDTDLIVAEIEIWVVAIGEHAQANGEMLNAIASDPVAKHIRNLASFDELGDLADHIASKING